MEEIKRIGKYNLLVLISYTLLFKFIYFDSSQSLVFAIYMLIVVGIHVATNIFLCIINDKSTRKAYLVSAGMVLLIGFSACIGGGFN